MERIVVQPNGKYAIFSSIVDDFIAYDGTPEEIQQNYRDKAIEDADRMSARMMAKASAEGLRQCLDTVTNVHGVEHCASVKKSLGVA